MHNFTIYPRGFAPALTPGGDNISARVAAVDGDEQVTLLYKEFFAKHGDYRSWEFKAQILRAAKRLIGRNFRAWIDRQVANPYLNDNAISFIADLLKFIRSGRRSIDTLNWLPILQNIPSEGLVQARRIKLSEEDLKFADSLGQYYLSAWLRQHNGIEDLLISLYCMFGEVSTPKALEVSGAQELQSPKNFKADFMRRALS